MLATPLQKKTYTRKGAGTLWVGDGETASEGKGELVRWRVVAAVGTEERQAIPNLPWRFCEGAGVKLRRDTHPEEWYPRSCIGNDVEQRV